MKRTGLSPQLVQVLQTVHYASLATADVAGVPSVTPLAVSFDKNMVMYWVSARSSRHSRNIARNGQVAAVLYDSRAAAGEGLGLYLQQTARVLTTAVDIAAAQATYDISYFHHGPSCTPFRGRCPLRMYCATPQAIWRNGEATQKGHNVDVRRTTVKC